MFIDANEITALINKWENICLDARMPCATRAAAESIIRDLEGLIDKESARIERMMDRMSEEDCFANGGY